MKVGEGNLNSDVGNLKSAEGKMNSYYDNMTSDVHKMKSAEGKINSDVPI